MKADTLILFSDVTFGFGEETVIHQCSFEVPAGQHTVLKGDSGSGKSTILKLILGFFTPREGNISHETDGRIRSQTAWLPQDLNIGEGTTRDVLTKPFEFAVNSTRTVSRTLLAESLLKLGLSPENLDTPYRKLSTGQRQRVGLVLCHLLNKPLILLDEPTSALDRRSKERSGNLLLGHTNKTVISASHDPYWVGQADHVIELN